MPGWQAASTVKAKARKPARHASSPCGPAPAPSPHLCHHRGVAAVRELHGVSDLHVVPLIAVHLVGHGVVNLAGMRLGWGGFGKLSQQERGGEWWSALRGDARRESPEAARGLRGGGQAGHGNQENWGLPAACAGCGGQCSDSQIMDRTAGRPTQEEDHSWAATVVSQDPAGSSAELHTCVSARSSLKSL